MKIIITESQHEFIRRYYTLKELVENTIDVYGEMNCPDDPEIVTESLTDLMLRRRYDDIKSWVRSDYNFLLDSGETPNRAKEMTLDHSAGTYLDNEDNEIEFTGKNFEKLSIFIEDNFEDIIS